MDSSPRHTGITGMSHPMPEPTKGPGLRVSMPPPSPPLITSSPLEPQLFFPRNRNRNIHIHIGTTAMSFSMAAHDLDMNLGSDPFAAGPLPFADSPTCTEMGEKLGGHLMSALYLGDQ